MTISNTLLMLRRRRKGRRFDFVFVSASSFFFALAWSVRLNVFYASIIKVAVL